MSTDEQVALVESETKTVKQSTVNQERLLQKFAHDEVFGRSREEYDLEVQHRRGNKSQPPDEQTSRRLHLRLGNLFMIMPSSCFRLLWDSTSMVLVMFIAITLPYRVAYLIDCPSFVFAAMDVAMDLFFLTDIVLNFRTAIVEDGELITSPRAVARKYLLGWFWLDLLSSVPFDWFLQDGLIANGFQLKRAPCLLLYNSSEDSQLDAAVQTQAFSLLRIFKVVKLLRLLRIARLFRYLSRWEEQFIQFNSSTIRMFKLIIAVLLFSHWNGCFQFLVAALAREGGEFSADSWVYRAKIHNKEPLMQWSWSFFHAASQLLAISVGVVPPMRPIELWLYLTSMLLGATMYAVFVASVTAFFADADPSAREYRAKLDMVNQYMRHAQLPRKLRQKLRTYYELRYPGGRSFDEPAIMAELSSPLTQQVRMHKCRSVLTALNIVDSDKTLAYELSERLTRVVFVTGDYIIRAAEISDGMYFISSGSVEIVGPATDNPKEEEVITTLGAHSFFGEMALLNPDGKATASVRVITYFEGYMLRYTDYAKLVQNHPSLHDYMQAAAKLRLRARNEMMDEKDASLETLFAMLDPTKRKLLKQEKESRVSVRQGPMRRDKLPSPPIVGGRKQPAQPTSPWQRCVKGNLSSIFRASVTPMPHQQEDAGRTHGASATSGSASESSAPETSLFSA